MINQQVLKDEPDGKEGKENFEQEELSVNSMFRKTHMDSAKAEWVWGAQQEQDLLSRSQAKRNTTSHSKECGVSTFYERKKNIEGFYSRMRTQRKNKLRERGR